LPDKTAEPYWTIVVFLFLVSTLKTKSFCFGAETDIIGAETNTIGAEKAGLFHIRGHFKYKGGPCVFVWVPKTPK
jgi:hypothetical protein